MARYIIPVSSICIWMLPNGRVKITRINGKVSQFGKVQRVFGQNIFRWSHKPKYWVIQKYFFFCLADTILSSRFLGKCIKSEKALIKLYWI